MNWSCIQFWCIAPLCLRRIVHFPVPAGAWDFEEAAHACVNCLNLLLASLQVRHCKSSWRNQCTSAIVELLVDSFCWTYDDDGDLWLVNHRLTWSQNQTRSWLASACFACHVLPVKRLQIAKLMSRHTALLLPTFVLTRQLYGNCSTCCSGLRTLKLAGLKCSVQACGSFLSLRFRNTPWVQQWMQAAWFPNSTEVRRSSG